MKMNTIFATVSLLFCVTAGAIPQAGTPSFSVLVKESQAYQNAISTIGVTGEPQIERAELPESLASGTCRLADMSRSGSIVKITAQSKTGDVVFFIGSESSLADKAVLCQ